MLFAVLFVLAFYSQILAGLDRLTADLEASLLLLCQFLWTLLKWGVMGVALFFLGRYFYLYWTGIVGMAFFILALSVPGFFIFRLLRWVRGEDYWPKSYV